MDENPRITLTQELHAPEMLPQGVFLDRALARGLAEVRMDGWPTGAISLVALGTPLLHLGGRHGESALYELDGVLLQVSLGGAHVQALAAAAETAALDSLFARLHDLLPPPDPSSAHEVPVTFWTYSPHGPQPSWRAIGVPGWDEIRDNYPAKTRAALESLMIGFQPAHGGQLVLWHGPAGTGKTFALRALAWEWRDWCQLHYVVDPDSFFGQHADYLMSVLMQPTFPMMVARGGAWASAVVPSEQVALEGAEEAEERPWRVLLLEDAGELLAADARSAMGQGLSRFLNVVDGLIGQGLRVLVLVTTNEEIRRLHPAVSRPGRCAANIQFAPMAADEAREWLRRNGVEDGAGGTQTLASLYAQLHGRDPNDVSLVGFAS